MNASGSTMVRSGLIAGVSTAVLIAAVAPAGAQEVLPRPEPPFQGTIGRTVKDALVRRPKKTAGRSRGRRA